MRKKAAATFKINLQKTCGHGRRILGKRNYFTLFFMLYVVEGRSKILDLTALEQLYEDFLPNSGDGT